jgi:hypothetical protein
MAVLPAALSLLAIMPHCVLPAFSFAPLSPLPVASQASVSRLFAASHRARQPEARGRPRLSSAARCNDVGSSGMRRISYGWWDQGGVCSHALTCVLDAAGSPQEGGEESDGGAGNSAAELYERAQKLLEDAGGQLDSLAFGIKWKKAYPGDDLEKYKSKGACVCEFSKVSGFAHCTSWVFCRNDPKHICRDGHCSSSARSISAFSSGRSRRHLYQDFLSHSTDPRPKRRAHALSCPTTILQFSLLAFLALLAFRL